MTETATITSYQDLIENLPIIEKQQTTNSRPIVVVDGMNIFIRHFLVNESMNANGDLYGGAIGFIRAIKNIALTLVPSKMIVVWEQGGASPRRKKIYPEYKANRVKQKDFQGMYKNDRDELMADSEAKAKQLAFLTKTLKNLPVFQVYLQDCEGDDVVAYLVKSKFTQENCDKIIVSSDKDFYQLLDDPKVKIWNPAKKSLCEGKDVLGDPEYGIAPRNFCLARTIIGDPSDNIDGIGGIKFKTALKRWPDLARTDVDLNIDDLLNFSKKQIEILGKKSPKCYSDLIAGEEILRRNWQLMYLSSNCLAPTQIEKINFRLDEEEKLTCNYLGYIKCFMSNEITVTADLQKIPQDLKFLSIH